ncbi:hypothetical protein SNEBB_005695 [Seison nebaliae]|nr:hypothetical protein SNEBB_005695 [Seison nebaliae]
MKSLEEYNLFKSNDLAWQEILCRTAEDNGKIVRHKLYVDDSFVVWFSDGHSLKLDTFNLQFIYELVNSSLRSQIKKNIKFASGFLKHRAQLVINLKNKYLFNQLSPNDQTELIKFKFDGKMMELMEMDKRLNYRLKSIDDKFELKIKNFCYEIIDLSNNEIIHKNCFFLQRKNLGIFSKIFKRLINSDLYVVRLMESMEIPFSDDNFIFEFERNKFIEEGLPHLKSSNLSDFLVEKEMLIKMFGVNGIDGYLCFSDKWNYRFIFMQFDENILIYVRSDLIVLMKDYKDYFLTTDSFRSLLSNEVYEIVIRLSFDVIENNSNRYPINSVEYDKYSLVKNTSKDLFYTFLHWWYEDVVMNQRKLLAENYFNKFKEYQNINGIDIPYFFHSTFIQLMFDEEEFIIHSFPIIHQITKHISIMGIIGFDEGQSLLTILAQTPNDTNINILNFLLYSKKNRNLFQFINKWNCNDFERFWSVVMATSEKLKSSFEKYSDNFDLRFFHDLCPSDEPVQDWKDNKNLFKDNTNDEMIDISLEAVQLQLKKTLIQREILTHALSNNKSKK